MRRITTIDDLRAALAARRGTARIGLVPTMGNLHEGHLSLVEAARRACDITVVSVFVNPMQFGPNEDFEAYPRTLPDDTALLERSGADIAFAPTEQEMYPHGRSGHTTVSVPRLANILCGAHRPGHFDGVATVVLKLFNIVAPDRAFFGQKDFQQLTLIRTFCAELDLPIEITGVPTVRAADGLALSSRNRYLGPDERAKAPLIHRTLTQVTSELAAGNREYAVLEHNATTQLNDAGFAVDYVSIRGAGTLDAPTVSDRELVVLAAARIGRTRLIDNLRVRV
jgi:pantoate--beta-alanine ligase